MCGARNVEEHAETSRRREAVFYRVALRCGVLRQLRIAAATVIGTSAAVTSLSCYAVAMWGGVPDLCSVLLRRMILAPVVDVCASVHTPSVSCRVY